MLSHEIRAALVVASNTDQSKRKGGGESKARNAAINAVIAHAIETEPHCFGLETINEHGRAKAKAANKEANHVG